MQNAKGAVHSHEWRLRGVHPSMFRLEAYLQAVLDGYEARSEPLPEDPFRRSFVDYVALCHETGICVRALCCYPPYARAIDATRLKVGVRLRCVEGGSTTYQSLLVYGRQRRREEAQHTADPNQAARNSVRALRSWMTAHSRCEIEPVGNDFDRLEQFVPWRRAGVRPRNWASEMRRWAGYHRQLRLQETLPDGFTLALRELCRRRGMTPVQLVKAANLPRHAVRWCEGLSGPAWTSQPHIKRLEMFFQVTPGTLSARVPDVRRSHGGQKSCHPKDGRSYRYAKHLPPDFAERSLEEQESICETIDRDVLRQKGPYAERLQAQRADRYRLAARDWPTHILETWLATIQSRPSGLRPAGSPELAGESNTRLRRKEADSEGLKPGTVDRYEKMLSCFFGFLTRSRRQDPLGRLCSVEAAKCNGDGASFDGGLGIPRELLTFGMFLLPDLVVFYMRWASRRSGGENHSLTQLLTFAKLLVVPDEGIVARTPSLLAELERLVDWLERNPIGNHRDGVLRLPMELIRSDWSAACAYAEAAYRKRFAEVRKRLVLTRDPFVPLLSVLSSERPLKAYMPAIHEMLASKPDKITQCMAYHEHIRNCVLVLIETQVFLRCRNPRELTYRADGTGQLKFRDGTWRIDISRHKFKNSDSQFFGAGPIKYDYGFELDDEDGLYDLLDEYVSKSLPILKAGGAVDAFFVNENGQPFSENAFAQLWRRLTITFFVYNPYTGRGLPGVMPHGMHALRDIGATDVVKATGDFSLAGWAIQDTAETARRHYARFLPEDRSVLVKKHLRSARAAARAERTPRRPA